MGWGLDDRDDESALLEAQRGLEQARLMSEHIRGALGKTTLSGLTSATTYYFRVRPILKTGEAAWSQIVMLVVP